MTTARLNLGRVRFRYLESTYRQTCARVVEVLQDRKGQWRRIAAESGVPYDTLWKIADGKIASPTVDTLQKLIDYFAPRRRKARRH